MVTKNFEKISDEKKEQIITKGIEIFSKFSFVEARTDLITHEAGISKGLLFYYFGNKKDLYEHLIGFVLNKLFDEITAQIDWNEKDVFKRIKSLVIVKIKVGQVYPNMLQFFSQPMYLVLPV